ncbi:XkdX family protein [Bacillus velezensis]|uniref:XkdX family protein n=1 Tax=Bacillus velezensis TaxID=492670 RepID=UPI000CF0E3E8|nr:XkdX family protein [Bacillus velezensis]MCM3278817.1 XkdX family protein [Bacillus velezensis]MCM3351896.1 XkdX family protein [Bacillus velezensis]PQB10556.1 XkdX family protein [Bacillus velezensis]PQB13077.1 XkdX family protein [Bacillus velezensis]PQB13087.1 XkdX family protein [Bacillus velezensis]
MDWYNSIKGWYERGFWTKEMVADAVRYGKITLEQYKEITGEDYPTPGEEPSEKTDGSIVTQ